MNRIKHLLLTALIGAMPFVLKAQISDELLGVSIENGMPLFGALEVNPISNEFVVGYHSHNEYECGLVSGDANLQPVLYNEEHTLCGVSRIVFFNKQYYLSQSPFGADPGHSGGSGVGLTIGNGNTWDYIGIGEPSDEYGGFFKGVSLVEELGEYKYYYDLNLVLAKKRPIEHYSFQDWTLVDSFRIFAVKTDSILLADPDKVLKRKYFPYADSIQTSLPHQGMLDGQVLLNLRDSVALVDLDLNTTQLVGLGLGINTRALSIHPEGKHIYVVSKKRGRLRVFTNLHCYDQSFKHVWTAELEGQKVAISQVKELGDHVLLTGKQGSYFGFVKSLDIKTGKELVPAASIEVLDVKVDRLSNKSASVSLKIGNTGKESITSFYCVSRQDYITGDVFSYHKVEGLNILPGDVHWVALNEEVRPVYTDIDRINISFTVGMPNDRTNASGTKSIRHSDWYSSTGIYGQDLDVVIRSDGFSISGSTEGDFNVRINDINGKLIESFANMQQGHFQLAKGVYVLVYEKDQIRRVQKFAIY